MGITSSGGNSTKLLKICDAWIEAALIALIVFTPLTYGTVQTWAIALFEFIAGVMGLLYMGRTLKLGKLSHIHSPLDLFFLVIIGYAFLQLIFPSIPGVKNVGLRSICPQATKAELLRVISYGLIFFLTLSMIKTRHQVTRVITVIIATGFLLSLFYLVRYFGIKAPQGLINRDHFSAYLAMIIPLALGFLLIPSRYTLFPGRPATSDLRSSFSAAHPRPDLSGSPIPSPRPEQRILLFFCILVISAGLFFTLSRGGMLNLIGAFIVMAVLSWTKKLGRYQRWLLPATVICITLMIVWLGKTAVVERIGTIKEEILTGRFAGRTALWKETVGLVKNSPAFGTGLGTFQYNYITPEHGMFGMSPIRWRYAHSDVLELLSETGIPVFLALAVAGLYFLVYVFKRFDSCSDSWTIALSIGLFGSLTSIFIHSFVDFSLKIPAISILLAVELALLVLLFNLDSQTPESAPKEYVIPRSVNIILYPLSVLLAALFMIMAIKPAVADYYYRRSQRNSLNLQSKIHNLKSAVRFDPSNASYHYELANLALKQPRTTYNAQRTTLSNALAEYRKAVTLDPKNSKYRQSLAWTYGRLADRLYSELKSPGLIKTYLRKAIDEFEAAISLDPDNPYRRRAYAIWLFKHPIGENVKRGVAEYRRAIELEPDLAEEGIQRYYKLQRNFKKLYRVLPGTVETDFVFFEFLLKEKGLGFAADFAAKYLKTFPDNERLNYFLAVKTASDKRISWEFKEECYNRLFEISPRDSSYRERYGGGLYRRGEYEEAIRNFKTAIELGLAPGTERRIRELMRICEERLLPAESSVDDNEEP